jgi:HAD superfamily hydrolase (TIGR01509 family)
VGQDVRHDVTQPERWQHLGSRVLAVLPGERAVVIRAVVLDIGSVLEVIDDSVFPTPFEERHGLAPGSVGAASDWPRDAILGEMTAAEVRGHWQERLGLSDAQVDELVADSWRWYVGSLDQRLFDWFAGLRDRGLRTGILSNSGPGAREAERHYGFEEVTDDIVYSHEVGLKKPDPAVFELTASRLGVESAEVAFLDDVSANVAAARAAGWHAVLHEDTERSIAAIEALIAAASG